MSSSSILQRKPPTEAEWEQMKSVFTEIWLDRARNNEDLVAILRGEYGFFATKKTCSTHLQRWGLSTYKKRKSARGPEEPRNSMRKRKGPLRQTTRAIQLRPIVPSPATNTLLRPNVYRPQEMMLYSIDQFIAAVFGDSIRRFTHMDLMRPKLNEGLRWERIADVYWVAENNLRAGRFKKFKNGLNQAHQELRILASRANPWNWRILAELTNTSAVQRVKQNMEPLTAEGQVLHYHAFLTKFWRVCHQLLRKDLGSQYEFSFVADFLLELERLLHSEYGSKHPIRELLYALCQVTKKDMKDTLEIGASRTVEVMGPAVSSTRRRVILRYWKAFT